MAELTFSFSGKTALVTGATSGIGRAMAGALCRAGARVFVNSEDVAECQRTVSEFIKEGCSAEAAPCDVSDGAEVAALATEVWARACRLDMLFCNAGVMGSKRASDDGYEGDVVRTFAINLHHARILCERLLPKMAETGGGSAVLTSSLSGLRGNANIGVYSLTKAAVAQLARDMAVKWGPRNVRVNAISPGLIATGWEKNVLSNPEAAERRMRMTPLRRVGAPEEIAAAALFLASDGASFITGHNLVADGGTLITDSS